MEYELKQVIISAVFRALCRFMILILLTIGFQYYIWERYEPEYRIDMIVTRLPPSSHPCITDRKQVQEYNREIDRELGIPSHFTPDLWPFSDNHWYPSRY
jgi:hypothetical protein